MVTVLALAWMGLVAGAAASRRPLAAARLATLGLRVPRPPMPRVDARHLLHWGAPALLAAIVHPVLAVGLIAAVVSRPWLAGRSARRQRGAEIDRGVADAVALIGLAVSAGHNLFGALEAAARRSHGVLAAELGRAVHEARRGTRLADALDALADRLGDPVRPLTSALAACERYGAAIGPTLERLGSDVRVASRQRAEAAARRVPVKLLFPLVTCILPAFGLLTVAPLIAGSLDGLGL